MISLFSVTVLKGAKAALSRCDLQVQKGAFVSLLGPSGAGKTTLLRTIAGFERPASGTVSIDARDLSGIPPHRRGVSMVFQDLALWPHLSVEGNLLLALSGAGLTRPQRRARAAEALARWGLRGMEARTPDQLSGGERQRLALARAWGMGKPVLLLDEPASALDRPAREALLEEVLKARREENLTVLYVTHQQDEALRVSDRIVVLMDGQVVQSGTRDDLMDRPASAAVSGFLGGGG